MVTSSRALPATIDRLRLRPYMMPTEFPPAVPNSGGVAERLKAAVC